MGRSNRANPSSVVHDDDYLVLEWAQIASEPVPAANAHCPSCVEECSRESYTLYIIHRNDVGGEGFRLADVGL